MNPIEEFKLLCRVAGDVGLDVLGKHLSNRLFALAQNKQVTAVHGLDLEVELTNMITDEIEAEIRASL